MSRKKFTPPIKENDDMIGLTGLLAAAGDTTHQFGSKNECPYFAGKSELCLLSGKVCLHDSETFPVCKTYKTGVERQLPGVKGQQPTVPPVSDLTSIDGPPPIDGPPKPLIKS